MTKVYVAGWKAVKVSKSRKQILKFSFAPKNERKHFCISALAYKKRSNQKSSVSKRVKIHDTLHCQYQFYIIDMFLSLEELFRNTENLKTHGFPENIKSKVWWRKWHNKSSEF